MCAKEACGDKEPTPILTALGEAAPEALIPAPRLLSDPLLLLALSSDRELALSEREFLEPERGPRTR